MVSKNIDILPIGQPIMNSVTISAIAPRRSMEGTKEAIASGGTFWRMAKFSLS